MPKIIVRITQFYVVSHELCPFLNIFCSFFLSPICKCVNALNQKPKMWRHFTYPLKIDELPSIDNLRCLFKVSNDVIMGRREGCFLRFISPTKVIAQIEKLIILQNTVAYTYCQRLYR